MGFIKLLNGIVNGKNIPVAYVDALANRPASAAPGAIFITNDQAQNEVFQYTAGTWVVIGYFGGAGEVTGADNGLHLNGTLVEFGGNLSADTFTLADHTGNYKMLELLASGELFVANDTGANTLIVSASGLQVPAVASASGKNLLQADSSGNITPGIIYNEVAYKANPQTITITAGTQPTGPTSNYQWHQEGKLVTAWFTIGYSSAGATCTTLGFNLPADMPTPLIPSATTIGALQFIAAGVGDAIGSGGAITAATFRLSYSTALSAYTFSSNFGSTSLQIFIATINYFTA